MSSVPRSCRPRSTESPDDRDEPLLEAVGNVILALMTLGALEDPDAMPDTVRSAGVRARPAGG